MTASLQRTTDVRSGTWPAPLAERPVMTQVWQDVSFAHWPVDPERIQRLLPSGVVVDEFAGSAWVSMVGFEMRSLRVPGLPPIPTTDRFPEFNVRTYVDGRYGPGVWFFSLDTPHWLPSITARVAFALPYCVGRVDSSHAGALHSWEIRRRWPDRTSGSMSILVGDAIDEPTDLDRFLTDRWRLYARTRVGGRLLSAPVAHEPWPLHTAMLLEIDTDVARHAVGPIEGDPLLHHADRVAVQVGRPRWA